VHSTDRVGRGRQGSVRHRLSHSDAYEQLAATQKRPTLIKVVRVRTSMTGAGHTWATAAEC
jgi:hypothetical protein